MKDLLTFRSEIPNEIKQVLLGELEHFIPQNYQKRFWDRTLGWNVSRSYKINEYSKTSTPASDAERIKPVLDWIVSLYPGHTIFQAGLNAMEPEKVYPIHVDSKLFHKNSTRLHIGLTGNANCDYLQFEKIDGRWNKKVFNITELTLYEFNNNDPHSVHNRGTDWRVNFVVDVMDTALMQSRTDWRSIQAGEDLIINSLEKEFSADSDLRIYSLAAQQPK